LLAYRSSEQVRTWHNAISIWENCVRVTPLDEHFRYALAERLAARGDQRRAIQEYDTLLAMQPDFSKAAIKLAWLLVSCDDRKLRDTQRAIKLAEGAFRRDMFLFRGLADVRSRVAEDLVADERYRDAIALYQSALEVDPANQTALVQLAQLLTSCRDVELRDPKRAIELSARADLLRRNR
jgi:tetratricopeptide (TPR) repeat protein